MAEVELKTGYVKSFDDEKIFYEIHGSSGEVIFFVYGIACLFNHWHKQISYFSPHHKTIMYDFRGHHNTSIPKDKNTLTIHSLAKDLLAIIDQHKIQKVHVVGHSFGSQVVLEAYNIRPDLFKTMTLINGFYKNPFYKYVDKKLIQEGINNIVRLYNKTPKVVSGLWKNLVNNPLLIPLSNLMGGFNLSHTKIEDVQIYSNGVSQLDLRVFLTLFSDMVNYDGSEIVKHISCPAQIIGGGSDSITPPEQQKSFVTLNKNLLIEIIPKGSHCVQLDFPQVVNQLIGDLIKKSK